MTSASARCRQSTQEVRLESSREALDLGSRALRTATASAREAGRFTSRLFGPPERHEPFWGRGDGNHSDVLRGKPEKPEKPENGSKLWGGETYMA